MELCWWEAAEEGEFGGGEREEGGERSEDKLNVFIGFWLSTWEG